MSTSRELFFARVRQALGKDGKRLPAAVPAIDTGLVRLCAQDEDLVARFTLGAAGLGTKVHRLATRDLAVRFATLVDELGLRSATVSPCDGELLELARSKLAIVDWRAGKGLDAHYDADAGVTDAHAGLAETGSLVLHSDARRSRGAFLVPPVHVCVLRASQIVADLVDLWVPAPGSLPTSLTIVSGPSKTADIEGILITGVHGPRAVHVLLCEDS